jgi:N utilization substance protein B
MNSYVIKEENKMIRRDARELLFTLIFEYSYKTEMDYTEVYAVAVQEREIEDDEYLKDGFEGVIVNLENIDSKIAENLNGWSMSRLSKATLAVLRVAVYEMLYREDIPFNVSINEAVELAKKYDDEKSPKFINGVLNSVADKEGLKQ